MLTISPSEFLRVTFAASPSGDSYWYSIHFIRSTRISTNTTVIKGSRINHIVANFSDFFRGIHACLFTYATLANIVRKITSWSL